MLGVVDEPKREIFQGISHHYPQHGAKPPKRSYSPPAWPQSQTINDHVRALLAWNRKATDHPVFTPDVLPNLLPFTTQMQQCCSRQKGEPNFGEITDLLIVQNEKLKSNLDKVIENESHRYSLGFCVPKLYWILIWINWLTNCSILRSVTDTLQTNTKSFDSGKTKQPLGRCLTVSSSEASKQATLIEGIGALYPTARKYHLLLLVIDAEPADWDPEIASASAKFQHSLN